MYNSHVFTLRSSDANNMFSGISVLDYISLWHQELSRMHLFALRGSNCQAWGLRRGYQEKVESEALIPYSPPVYKHEYSLTLASGLRHLIWVLPQWSVFGTHPLPTLFRFEKPSVVLSDQRHVSCSSTSWLPLTEKTISLERCSSESLEPSYHLLVIFVGLPSFLLLCLFFPVFFSPTNILWWILTFPSLPFFALWLLWGWLFCAGKGKLLK